MDLRKTSKGVLGAKLSQRDTQFTVAIRKAEIRNSNENKNMKKSIEQFSKEHQQVLKNLKREQTCLMRKLNLRKHPTTLAETGKKNPISNSTGDSQEAEKFSENHLPHIDTKEERKSFPARFGSKSHKSTENRSFFGRFLPKFVEKDLSLKRDRAVTDSKVQSRGNSFGLTSSKNIERRPSNRGLNLNSSFPPRKLHHSVSYEADLSTFASSVKRDESNRLKRKHSVDLLHRPSHSTSQASNEKAEDRSFFKTSL